MPKSKEMPVPRATLTSKGQVTIPKLIRDRLGLRAGDRLDFKLERNGTLVVQPLDPDGELPSLAGFLKGRVKIDRPVSIEEMDRAMQAHVAEHVMRSLSPRDDSGDDDRS
ncbi:AbrB/MazE/SpoVT family DNA-binding domain-containing protein [soil metagenome]